jgi:phytoene desaturase
LGKKVGIIGSGIGGLAVAVRLASKGFDVTVFEASSEPGGKMGSFSENGFRFDKGPSLFTMPHLIEEVIKCAAKNPEDYLEYNKLNIACNYFWEDGTRLSGYANPSEFAEEVENKLGVKKQRVLKHLGHSEELNDLCGRIFLENSLHKLSTFLTKDTLRAIANLYKLDLFKTMHQANASQLRHPKLIQYFDRFATYNGSSPYLAPGILNIIPSLEHGDGVYFPKGGMRSIPLSLYHLAKDLKVNFRFNAPVEKIMVNKNVVKGIITSDGGEDFDLIVSNMDIYPTYKKLLPDLKPPHRILNQNRSSSAVVFYWGISRVFEELELHNIFFSDNYEREFEHLFNTMDIDDDPTVYINISSKENPKDAPEGKENWFVMVNAPHNTGQDWDDMVSHTRKAVVNKLNRMLQTDITDHIEVEHTWDPVKIESETFSHQGSIYGNSSNNRMAAFLRHPNFSRKIKGLYFTGGSVHPGGGIPLSLLSAKIVEDLIE